MATTVETDLKEVLEKIDRRLEAIETTQLSLQIGVGKIDEKVTGLDKRLDIIESRVNGLTGWLIGVLLGLVGGLLGVLAKVVFFPNP